MSYVNLLDKLVEGRDLPAGCTHWAVRSVRPDLTSSHGYRYPWPGNWAEAPGPIHAGYYDGECPSEVGDGICAATTWSGMGSAGIPATTLLLVAYHTNDVLGASIDKMRLRRMFVVDIIDGAKLLRIHGQRAELTGAHLEAMDLGAANLAGANLSNASLYGAWLNRADLAGAVLNGAYMCGARLTSAVLYGADLGSAYLGSGRDLSADLFGALYDDDTRWPPGFDPGAAGAAYVRGSHVRGSHQ